MKKYIIIIIIALISICLIVVSIHYHNNLESNCNNIEQLSDLLGIDFENHNIKNIDSKFDNVGSEQNTWISVCFIDDNDMDLYEHFTESQLPTSIYTILEDNNIDKDDIARVGVNYKEYDVSYPNFSKEYRPYPIWLIELKNSESNLKTFFVVSTIPYKVKIDIS